MYLISEVRVGPCFEQGLGSSDITPLRREEQSRPVSSLRIIYRVRGTTG